jgi:3-hydroxyisobutyrate dehydrogenase-like beta-hydroxyacid dehydrogenase
MKPAIGLIGVGLMGHGIARNVLKHGYKLTVLEHPGNRPMDELKSLGVATRTEAADVAQSADIVILCVTGTPQVEEVLMAANGVLAGLRPRCIVVDCSTAVPASTVRMAAQVEAAGGRFIDAPMTKSVQQAHDGTLNLLVGGAPEVVDEVRPVLACFAENITLAGGIGAGHRMKLLHNFVSIGFISLLAEAAACARRTGVPADVFIDVLAGGGGGGVSLERLRPYLLSGDASSLQFFISNGLKDIDYYREMAQATSSAREIADAVAATLAGVIEAGAGQKMLPELVSCLADAGAARK